MLFICGSHRVRLDNDKCQLRTDRYASTNQGKSNTNKKGFDTMCYKPPKQEFWIITCITGYTILAG